MLLDVGCGVRKFADWDKKVIGMDVRCREGVDVVADIEKFPWPFKDETFRFVRFFHVMEHVKPWLTIDVMNEAHRVLKPGGMAALVMPYPGSQRFWQDPTHVKSWGENTYKYFDPQYSYYNHYRPRPWKVHRHDADPEGDVKVLLERI